MELVTVIMPVYNNQRFLFEALDSICNLEYKNLDIIIIDDGSTDDSYSICTKYAIHDKRIRIFKHTKNRGTSAAIQTGLLNAKSKYIFFAAADDCSLPNRIDKCMEIFLNNDNVGVIVSNAIIIDENSAETGEIYEVPRFVHNDNIAINQFARNYCLGATMAIQHCRGMLLDVKNADFLDDYQISIEYILNQYEIFVLHEELIKYRIHQNNQSNNRRALTKKTQEMLKQYDISNIRDELLRRGETKGDSDLYLGIFELFRGNVEQALQLFLQCEKQYNYDKRNDFLLAFYLGVIFYKSDDLIKSRFYFERAYAFDNQEPTVLNNLGVLLAKESSLMCAQEMIKSSLKLKEDYIDAHKNLELINDNPQKMKLTERLLDTCSVKRENYKI